jgi:hypothetical protein
MKDTAMYDNDVDPEKAAEALHMGAVEMLKIKRHMRKASESSAKVEECMRVFVRNTPRLQFTQMGPALEKLAALPLARAQVYSAHDLLSQILQDEGIAQADDEKVYDDVPNLSDEDPDRFR